ncbi:MAG: class IV adenylate cyclase [Anaerolineales bacterium]|nr:MAG: class IV adenylate cyclase [Anaerolineales bacterium]
MTAENGRETEVKFYVRDLKKIEVRLLELKAHLIQPRVHEINLRFDNPSGDLRRQFKVLRLRKDTEAKFTFKGPSEQRADGVLSRREIEFMVGDFEDAKQFLEILGFVPVVFYEKFRATHELNGVHIMLDELPYGEFVEIEGENVNSLRAVARLLGLNWEAAIPIGYHRLFESVAGKYNLDVSQLSFEAVKPVRVSAEDLNIVPAD